VTANHHRHKEKPAVTTLADPATTVNARAEAVFLRAETYDLTARQLVHALAAHLTRYGDTLAVTVVDPLAAVDAVIRFDCGHHPDRLTAWTAGRTPADVARVLARAEQIARDYFGTGFPPIPW
jgi:hypothetical protein